MICSGNISITVMMMVRWQIWIFTSYTAMINSSPIETRLLEYRYMGDVIGVMMIDLQDDGLSAVYSFFDP